MKSSTSLARVKEIARGAKYGLFIYSAIAVLAWWFPYVAIVLSLLLWIYWLYLSTAFKHEDA
jgi:CHASE2 domain-containing sensor protein